MLASSSPIRRMCSQLAGKDRVEDRKRGRQHLRYWPQMTVPGLKKNIQPKRWGVIASAYEALPPHGSVIPGTISFNLTSTPTQIIPPLAGDKNEVQRVGTISQDLRSRTWGIPGSTIASFKA